MGKGLKGLILGGAVGAALGILYAPRSGKKTRALLAEKTEALWGEEAQKKGTILGEVAKTSKTAVNVGQNIFNEAKKGKFGEITREASKKSQELFKNTTNFVGDFAQENVRPVFSEKNDDLRKKIEAARKKIAKQVASDVSAGKTRTVKPATRKAPAAKKPAAKKTPAKKPAAKKPAAKKTAAKKTVKRTTKK